MDIEKLKEDIKRDAAKGIDFGCSCYYCGATPIDLVNRGDAIPIIYGDGKRMRFYCFRCSDECSYGGAEHITSVEKQKECIKAFSRKGVV